MGRLPTPPIWSILTATCSGVSSEPLDTTARVETPEHVRFDFQIAGPAKRFLAWLLDLLIQGGILIVGGIIAMFAGVMGNVEDLSTGASTGLFMVFIFVVEWFYFALFEDLWNGRTPGKKILKIKVVREGGYPLTFADALLRNLLRAADAMPMILPFLGSYAVALIVMGQDHRFRRLGDWVAGTMVVTDEAHGPGSAVQIHPTPSAAELAWLPSRPALSLDEMEAVELFLRRSQRLAPARMHELAEMIAPIFARRMNLTITDPVRFLQLVYAKVHQRDAGPETPYRGASPGDAPQPVAARRGDNPFIGNHARTR